MWAIYNASTHERLLESRNCHDFVEHVLRELNFKPGISPYVTHENSVSVYRDTLSLSVQGFKKVDMTNPKKKRDFQRLLRFMRHYVYEVTRDLSLSRYAVTRINKLGLRFIFVANGNEFYEIVHGNINSINYCRMPMDFVHGQEYVPALWNDSRKICYFPYFEIESLHKETPYTFVDLMLMIEQIIDDALFGEDGLGLPVLDHLTLITETTLMIVALSKFIGWVVKLKRI
jgi:hypothetical protein